MLNTSPLAFKYWITIVAPASITSGPATLQEFQARPIGVAAPGAQAIMDSGIGIIVISSTQRRVGGSAPPIDLTSQRWTGYDLAPSWDEDQDPEWLGFK